MRGLVVLLKDSDRRTSEVQHHAMGDRFTKKLDLKYMFVIADGKNVGQAIYSAIACGDLAKASQISESINLAIAKIKISLEERGVDVIFAGGDDILCKTQNPNEVIGLIAGNWEAITGLSIDIATGKSPLNAVEALDSLKGKKRLIAASQ